ncbi:MAG: polysaccharide biosynthesis protein [Gammaproteobacteria bacterium]|nr:polysaccharide biosynthesis protein [Gammaproteobacteria bacterium]
MYKKLTESSRNTKRALLVAIDFIALPVALWAGYALRLGEWWPAGYIDKAWWLFIAAPLVSVPIFIRMGLYRAVLRYVGGTALVTIVKAVSIITLILLALMVMSQTQGVPRSVFVSFWLISMLFIGGSRLFLRNYIHTYSKRRNNKQPVVVYGAGSAGAELVKGMQSGWEYEPVAFLDDDIEKRGMEIHGVKVYPPDYITALIETKNVTQVLLAMPSVTPRRRHKVLEKLEEFPVHVRTLPGITDLVSGKATISDIREVDANDVLGRDAVPPVPGLIEQCVRDKNVMVTGAGGSIGSELCRQIVEFGPSKLVLYEQSEFALYKIEKELESYSDDVEIIAVLGSVTNTARIEMILRCFNVHTVYHAAAYKHVPLVEHNPIEGLQNNVFGTWNTAEAARAAGVETFVLISTDKAVRPTNVMGATKRFSELVLQAMDDESETTRFTMVRFGNVLDSSGSVIPLFRKQIKKGGPVTVTHPDVTRYFMTIPEAAQLVLQAGALGEGGDVFVLEMGESIKIDDLARRMIHLSGLEVCEDSNPDGDITIEYTGLRPGEKLYEELLIGDNVTGTEHPKIMRAAEEKLPWAQLLEYRSKFEAAILTFETVKIKLLLEEVVRGYKAEKDVVDPVWNQHQMTSIDGSGISALVADDAGHKITH